MAQQITSISGRWTFEIYDDKSHIEQTMPTAILIAEPFREGHNSAFPFKILGIYYVDNPKEYFLGNPPFIVNNHEKILLLQHTYSNVEEQLKTAVKMMQREFGAKAY